MEEKIKQLEEQMEFLKAVLGLDTFPNKQLESLYIDWKKKQGRFRSNKLG